MDREEYRAFEDAVRSFYEREEIAQLGAAINTDPFFSHKNCECCRRDIAGDRHTVPAITKNCDIDDLTYDICVDCFYYINYGKLDDMTMEDMR